MCIRTARRGAWGLGPKGRHPDVHLNVDTCPAGTQTRFTQFSDGGLTSSARFCRTFLGAEGRFFPGPCPLLFL